MDPSEQRDMVKEHWIWVLGFPPASPLLAGWLRKVASPLWASISTDTT